jgi:hypothetical protein
MMNITEIKRIIACAREAALCNADEDTPLVHLSLDDAERVIECLGKLEQLIAALDMPKAHVDAEGREA